MSKKFIIDICPECKVRENDFSKKKLYKCRYCERYFCKKHLPPRLTMMRSEIENVKDPVLRNELYEEWEKKDGHPDWQYTGRYLEMIKLKERQRREKMWETLDLLKEREWDFKEREEKPSLLPEILKGGLKEREEQKKEIPENRYSLKDFLNDFVRKIRNEIYNFLKYIFIVLTFLTLLHFFIVGKFGLLPLIIRTGVIVLLGYLLSLIHFKTKHIIPYKWLVLCSILILIAYIYSNNDYSVLKPIDTLIGIPNFSFTIINKLSQSTTELISKPQGIAEIGKSLFQYKTPSEELSDKIIEFRSNSTILEQKIHALINEERKRYGLSILRWDENLAKIARYHSEDMGKRNYLSHYTPEGEDLEMRYKKFGYICQISVGNLIYSGAENIFLTYIYSSYYYDPVTGVITKYVFNNLDNVSYEAVNGWMNSEGHRKNILTNFFSKEGIGVYISDDGKIYVTQNFC